MHISDPHKYMKSHHPYYSWCDGWANAEGGAIPKIPRMGAGQETTELTGIRKCMAWLTHCPMAESAKIRYYLPGDGYHFGFTMELTATRGNPWSQV